MPPASRITDMHTCPMVTGIVPHVGGPILPPGEPTVLIGMLPAARMTDMATCVGPPDSILMGSPTVLIGNLMAARIGDPTDHGGVIVLGEPTVEIGEVGMGTPTVVTPAPPLVILAQAMAAPGSAAAQAVSNAAQDLAQASQDGAATVAFKLANQPLAGAAGAPSAGGDDLPTVEFSASKYPELADNIRNAQLAGHPDVLTYGGDVAANRAAALRGVPNIPPLSRDEYPFASTLEGGEGSWVGHIPKSQQNAQGAILKNFYKANRIRPGDRFRVVVGK